MESKVFGCSVQGATHKHSFLKCQDSFQYKYVGDTIIMAVADGHGSKNSPLSKNGSGIAAFVFCDIMAKIYNGFKDTSEFLSFLNREGDTKIAQAIDKEWKGKIRKKDKQNNQLKQRDKKADISEENSANNNENNYLDLYLKYGTTLVGIMIAPDFIFGLQIGDGNISYVDNDGVSEFLVQEKILGTETHSLCSLDSWKNAHTAVYRKNVQNKAPTLIMLSTDGFANSYTNEDEFHKACLSYFTTINENGIDKVKQVLRKWLNATSKEGCGDDITLLMAYFPKIATKED